MLDKTIIIKGNNPVFFSCLDDVYMYYNSYSFFSRAFRKFTRKLGINCFEAFLYGKWKKEVKNCCRVILFDSEYSERVAKYIKKKNSGVKIIFWYWNSVKSHGKGVVNSEYIDEIWTYDRFDAKKYKLKYNPQLYHVLPFDMKNANRTDLIFLGKNKNRGHMLDQLKALAESQGLKCDFRLVEKRKDNVRYADYLKNVAGAKCVVDLVPSSPCGLTLRPLEALFMKKKLITNNVDIMNYDFYNKNNIFVIGKDDLGKLADFINGPYENVDKNIVDYYGYEAWLDRIVNGMETRI